MRDSIEPRYGPLPNRLGRCLASALMLAMALTATSPAAGQTPDGFTAFVGAAVVSMEDDRIQPGRTVLVYGDRIVRVGPADSVLVPPGSARIDARGKFLIPGLADMHVHLARDTGAARINRQLLEVYLAYGVTTLLNLSGRPHHLALQDSVARRLIRGPWIHTSGPTLDDSTLTFADGERLVAEHVGAGYQFIKVYNRLARPAYWGIVSAARRVGIPVVGHVVRGLGPDGLARCESGRVICHCEYCLEATLTSGQANIVHMEEITYGALNHHATRNRRPLSEVEPLIQPIARRIAASGVWLTPTLEAYKNVARQIESVERVMAQPEMAYVPPSVRANWIPGKNPYQKAFPGADASAFWEQDRLQERLVAAFHAAGVKLLAGTDAGIPAVIPGRSLHAELAHFVGAGLTPYQALVTATRHPAEFLGLGEESGTIAPGKRADLVLLDGNPLTDIGNTLRRAGVMVRGRWWARDAIDRTLAGFAAQ